MSENLSVEKIAAEFLERRDAGEVLDTEKFIAAYPEYADELRDLLGLMLDMEKVRSDQTQK